MKTTFNDFLFCFNFPCSSRLNVTMCVSVSFLTIHAYLCHDEGRAFIASNVILAVFQYLIISNMLFRLKLREKLEETKVFQTNRSV